MTVAAGDWQGLILLVPRGPVPVQLQESGPELLKLSLTLSSCALSLLTPSRAYSGNWIRQAPETGLEQTACITDDGDTYYTPSIQSHTSICRDTQEPVLPAAELCDR